MLPLKIRKGHCVYWPYRKNPCFSWLAGKMPINTCHVYWLCHSENFCFDIILRKHPIFRDATTSFPGKWRLKNKLRVMLMTCHYPDFAPDCMRQIINQSEALPRCGQWHAISVEFLLSFLRRHFAEELVVAWRNISCFLRVVLHCYWCYFCFVFFLSLVS